MKKHLLILVFFYFLSLPFVKADTITKTSIGEVINGIHYVLLQSDYTARVSPCYQIDNYVEDDGDTYTSYVSDYAGDIVIPEKVYFNGRNYTVNQVEEYAFYNCKDLTSVTLPKTITKIRTYAFFLSWSLSSITCLAPTPPRIVCYGGEYPYVHSQALLIVPIGCKNAYQSADGWEEMSKIVEGGTCGTGVNFIFEDDKILTISGNGLMDNYSATIKQPWRAVANSIETIIIDEGVQRIGGYAFSELTKLKEIKIPSSVTQGIGNYAFQNCTSLQSAEILSSSGFISTGAFAGCSQLSYVSISQGIARIWQDAFTGTAILDNQNAEAGVKYIDHCAIMYDGITSDVKIKEGTQLVADRAFYGAKINTVSLPSTLRYIGSSAFNGCRLTEVSFPQGLKQINNAAFQTNSFETISIPASVTYIDQYAFAYNSSLHNVIFEDGNEVIDLEKNEFSSGISKGVFGQSENIKYIYVGRNVQYDSFAARGPFFNYGGTSHLDEVEIGPDVTEVASGLFDGHDDINTVISRATSIPTLWWSSFSSKVYTSATLYVPAGYVNIYSQAAGWSSFSDIQEIVPTSFELTDNQIYQNDTDLEVEKFSYSRIFSHTNWQSIVLPIDLEYEDWEDQFEIAEILGVRIGDGLSVVDGIKLKDGDVAHANVPYMIRALVSDSSNPKVLKKENCTIKAAAPINLESSTTKQTFTFVGTYTGVDGPTMFEEQYYAMSGGGWKQVSNNTVSLKPYRCYLMAEDKESGYQGSSNAPIRDISVRVYDDENDIPIVILGDGEHRDVVINRSIIGLTPGMYTINGKTIEVK